MTLEQTYALAHACQRVENAAEAITLTNNPALGLVTTLAEQVALLLAIIAPVDPNASIVHGGVPLPTIIPVKVGTASDANYVVMAQVENGVITRLDIAPAF